MLQRRRAAPALTRQTAPTVFPTVFSDPAPCPGRRFGPLGRRIRADEIEITAEFVFALVYLALILSNSAMTLLFALLRRGATTQVANLIFLAPPARAFIAYLLFGETLGPAVVLA